MRVCVYIELDVNGMEEAHNQQEGMKFLARAKSGRVRIIKFSIDILGKRVHKKHTRVVGCVVIAFFESWA
jgi:hypothetical protein